MSADTLGMLGTIVVYLVVFPVIVMTGFVALVRHVGRNQAADSFIAEFIPHPKDVAATERELMCQHEGWL